MNRIDFILKARERIQQGLKSTGKSQYRVCKDLNISQGNFSRYLKGEDCILSAEVLQKITRYLD